MRVLKKGNSNTKSLSYTSLVRPIFEYGASCWDPYREGQINTLDRVQKKAAKFANLTNDSVWETLTHRRTVARILRPIQSLRRRAGMEVCRGQVESAMLREQG